MTSTSLRHLGIALAAGLVLPLASTLPACGGDAFRNGEGSPNGRLDGPPSSEHQDDTGGDEDRCTSTQGYWKNHNRHHAQNPIPWPIDEDTDLCGQTWLDILRTPPKGDAWYILAHQFIAASLNVASGVDATPELDGALAEAAALLESCVENTPDRPRAITLSELLDAFNNGLEGIADCDGGTTGETGDTGNTTETGTTGNTGGTSDTGSTTMPPN